MDLTVRKLSERLGINNQVHCTYIKQEPLDDDEDLYQVVQESSCKHTLPVSASSSVTDARRSPRSLATGDHCDGGSMLFGSREEGGNQVDRCEVCNEVFGSGKRARTTFHSKLHDFQLVVCRICYSSIEAKQSHSDDVVKEEQVCNDECADPSAPCEQRMEECEDTRKQQEKYAWTVYGARLPQHIINEGKLLFQEDSPPRNIESRDGNEDDLHLGHKLIMDIDGESADGLDECDSGNNDGDIDAFEDGSMGSQWDSDSGTPSESGAQEKHYSCNVCKKSFRQKGCLNRHLKTHTGEKPFECDTCSKTFSRSSNLRSHMRTHTGDVRYECPICQKIFGHNSWLKRHILTHTGEKQYRCEVCLKWVSSSTSLQSHMRTHTGEKPFICPTCHKGFSVKSTLTVHMRIHTGEKPYRCDKCHSYFAQGSQLRAHMRTHSKLLECSVCQREFITEEALAVHSKVHTEDMIFECKFCSQSFSDREGLKSHITVHVEEKLFQCAVCDKQFKRKDNLKEHLKVHTGEKPFECPVCHEAFSNKSHVKVHMRTHTGEKPYKCDICGKMFTQSSSVKNHMRIHTGEKPYQCHICLVLFTRATSVKKHIKRAHPETLEPEQAAAQESRKYHAHIPTDVALSTHMDSHGATEKQPFKCDVCDREFLNKYALKVHVRVHGKESGISFNHSHQKP